MNNVNIDLNRVVQSTNVAASVVCCHRTNYSSKPFSDSENPYWTCLVGDERGSQGSGPVLSLVSSNLDLTSDPHIRITCSAHHIIPLVFTSSLLHAKYMSVPVPQEDVAKEEEPGGFRVERECGRAFRFASRKSFWVSDYRSPATTGMSGDIMFELHQLSEYYTTTTRAAATARHSRLTIMKLHYSSKTESCHSDRDSRRETHKSSTP
ncbi:hypothetical protein CBL_05509 [Carabus blaptoides fortunei]